MFFADFKASVPQPLRQVSLVFLIKKDRILLAVKKEGFGQGNYNGVGGKQEADESILFTAARECREEIGVTPQRLLHVATLDFYFPEVPLSKNWNQRAFVYFCDEWTGKPKETKEMKPIWFKANEIPYGKMWADDQYWLPQALNGYFAQGEFYFGENNSIAEGSVQFFRNS